jgi:tetratricopeptide (TPR) repeat protein
MLILQGRIMLHKEEDLAAAAEKFEKGIGLLDATNEKEEMAEACYEVGNLLMRLGRLEEAGKYLVKATESYRKMVK